MKILVFGLGSIGARHCHNLKALRPDCAIVGVEPRLSAPLQSAISNGYHDLPVTWLFMDWRVALERHADADMAIIASPTAVHHEQMAALTSRRIPFYVEKPICVPDEIEAVPALISACTSTGLACAVGYQYRFHPVISSAAQIIAKRRHARFYACDNLLSRYGPDCLSTIAAHPIDTALWLLGPAREVDMETDGLSVRGMIRHERGISEHDYRIDTGPRVSMVSTASKDGLNLDGWSLDATNEMYRDALAAWLNWAEGGERDPRTATLADGLAAMEVAAQVKRKETEHA